MLGGLGEKAEEALPAKAAASSCVVVAAALHAWGTLGADPWPRAAGSCPADAGVDVEIIRG